MSHTGGWGWYAGGQLGGCGGVPRHHAPRHHAPRTREPGLVAFSRGLWRPGAIRVNTTWAILIARTIQIDMSCSHKLSFPAWHHCCSLHYAQSGGQPGTVMHVGPTNALVMPESASWGGAGGYPPPPRTTHP